MDRMARKALEETPLRLAMAASYEGAQRVANLEKAVRKICALSMEGSLGGAEVLDRVEEEEAAERAQGDSPLADETLNAVRILSIHKAKGLEWPVVILPDLARDLKSSPKTVAAGVMTDPRDIFRAESSRLPPALAVSVGKLRTPAHLLHDQIEELQRAAEAKRLLYVAATRARDRLILVAGHPQRGRRTWIQALSAWGYEIAGHFPPGESFAKGAVLHWRVEAAKPSASGKEGENPDPRVIEAARAYEKALRKVSEAKPRKILSPSSEQEDRVAADLGGETVETSVGERPGDRETAMAAGTAVHLLLELWDGKDPAWLLENAARAARAAAGRAGTKVEEVLARVREILEDVEDNGRIAELLREKPMAREMPILYEDQNGDIWDGTMDLVTGTPEAPRIVDYKTDAGSSREELQLLYAGQLARYSEGLQLALGLKAPPPARIELLRKLEKVNRTRG